MEKTPEINPLLVGTFQKDVFLEKLYKIVDAYNRGELGGETMPEDALVGVVNDTDLPNVITLSMALNYQRNSYSLWHAVARTYEDSSVNWIFDPIAVGRMDSRATREALLRHKVGLQPMRHVQIWQRIAEVLAESGGALELIQRHNTTISLLRETMQMTKKKDFPYISGPKIFNYWLYVMELYCGVIWQDRQEISVAPDTHILQASVRLGLVPAAVLDGSTLSRELVAEKWREVLKGSRLMPIDVHTPLWLWSRGGFVEV